MKVESKTEVTSNTNIRFRFFTTFLIVLIVQSTLMMSQFSFAQTKQSQLQCRAKSKEIAKTAYDDCMELAKGDEAENIRKEFKMKFEKLKAYYVEKLKKVTSKMKKENKNGPVPAVTEKNVTTSTSVTKSTSSLPPKVQTEIPVNDEVSTKSFVTPEPINTQSADSSNEPTIRLKNAPQTDESLQSPSSINEEAPIMQPSSEIVETAPDTTI